MTKDAYELEDVHEVFQRAIDHLAIFCASNGYESPLTATRYASRYSRDRDLSTTLAIPFVCKQGHITPNVHTNMLIDSSIHMVKVCTLHTFEVYDDGNGDDLPDLPCECAMHPVVTSAHLAMWRMGDDVMPRRTQAFIPVVYQAWTTVLAALSLAVQAHDAKILAAVHGAALPPKAAVFDSVWPWPEHPGYRRAQGQGVRWITRIRPSELASLTRRTRQQP